MQGISEERTESEMKSIPQYILYIQESPILVEAEYESEHVSEKNEKT